MSLPKAKDYLGSLRSQHKSIKNCSCKKLKSTSSHHSCRQLADATLGIREKEQQVHNMLFQAQERKIRQYPYQVHNMWFQAQKRKIHQYQYQVHNMLFQLPSTREENSPISVPLNQKKMDTVVQFQAQEREIHQSQYWTSCLLAQWHASITKRIVHDLISS